MSTIPKSDSAAVAQVQASIVGARDAQITRIVAMVDAMPSRGEADGLIAPLRQRLKQLRPTRALGFTRLLFTPLDPLIVPVTCWKPGDVGVPRSALAPIGAAIRAALTEMAEQTERALLAIAPDDQLAIRALGASLWPAAAKTLDRIAVPQDWSEKSGLGIRDYGPLAAVIRVVLAEAVTIEDLAAARSPLPDEAIRAVLIRAEMLGEHAGAASVAVLLGRLATPGQVLAVAFDTGGPAGRNLAGSALDHTLVQLKNAAATSQADDGDMTGVAMEASRVAFLLAGLDGRASPDYRRRLDLARREADALCLDRFSRAVTNATGKATAIAAEARLSDAAFTALETSLRDLRRLETAGRRLGSGERYDAMLQAVSTILSGAKAALCLVDRVRLVEILRGPDEALALMDAD